VIVFVRHTESMSHFPSVWEGVVLGWHGRKHITAGEQPWLELLHVQAILPGKEVVHSANRWRFLRVEMSLS
jgi:hypothetical protein